MGVVIGIVAGIVGLGIVFLVAALAIRQYKHIGENDKNVVETHEARYTADQRVEDTAGNANVSFNQTDIVLTMGVTYKVSAEEGCIKPGKYTVLTTEEGATTFNLRLGEYVKEYHHGEDVVLAPGSEITAVSMSIILR